MVAVKFVAKSKGDSTSTTLDKNSQMDFLTFTIMGMNTRSIQLLTPLLRPHLAYPMEEYSNTKFSLRNG